MYINQGAFLRTFFKSNIDNNVLMLLSEAPKEGMTNRELNAICVVSARLMQGTMEANGITLTVGSQSNYPGLLRKVSIDGVTKYAHSPRYVSLDTSTSSGTTLVNTHLGRVALTSLGLVRQGNNTTALLDWGKEMTFTHSCVSSAEGQTFRYTWKNNDTNTELMNTTDRNIIRAFTTPATATNWLLTYFNTGAGVTYSNTGCYMFTDEPSIPIPAITHAVIAKTFETSGADTSSTIFEVDLADIQMDAFPTDGICKSLNIRGIRIKI